MVYIRIMLNMNVSINSESPYPTISFASINDRTLTANFQGGHLSSDGGAVLLAQLDRSYGYLRRFATCFTDHRDPDRIEHSLEELLRQRVYGLSLGYADLNDHDQLRADPLLASLCGKADPLGQDRERAQDQGKALAGKSTLNRLELTPADAGAAARYQKIVAQFPSLEDYFINEWVRSLPQDTTSVLLDMDRTDDPLYGQQEGRFFHGYDDEYCYTPLYIFADGWPVVAALHTAESEHQAETLRLVAKAVERVRRRFAGVRVQATSGTIRVRLLKIGAAIRVTVRRVWVQMSSAFPWKDLFRQVAAISGLDADAYFLFIS